MSTVSVGTFISVQEAARILGCTGGRVRQLLLSGTLKGEKLNAKAWAIQRKAVEKYASIPQTKGRPRSGD